MPDAEMLPELLQERSGDLRGCQVKGSNRRRSRFDHVHIGWIVLNPISAGFWKSPAIDPRCLEANSQQERSPAGTDKPSSATCNRSGAKYSVRVQFVGGPQSS